MHVRLDRHRRWLGTLLTALLVPSLLTGCFLKKKKSSGKGSGKAELVDRQSIFFDRIGVGETGQLKFKTKKPALCELTLYAQEAGIEPTKDKPKVTACSGTDARAEFTEALEGLRTDALYFVVIRAWEAAESKEKGDVVTVREGQDPKAVITPGGDGKLKDLLVARLDVPLKTAEVHRHSFADATDVATIRTQLTRKEGCTQGVPDKDGPFREAAPDVAIANLATRDFAAGTAGPHPDYPGRLLLTYPSLNDGLDKWSLYYQLNGQDFAVTARSLARILNMEMESTSIMAFEAPQLAEAADPLKIDPTKPLKISWTLGGGPRPLAYMAVMIGRPDYEKSIVCVFKADQRTASIDPALLQGLDDGRHVLLAELASSQIWAKEGWLVTTYDWRSGRIEK
jgi:hypothetical protein